MPALSASAGRACWQRAIESLYQQEKLAVRGFAEVVKRLPEILRIRRGLVRELKHIRPDVFVGIDTHPILIWAWPKS